ncbi:MAG TPA: hypothetical protein VNS49_04475, partial [Streptomyces sp.]|nr:hypothetical protein [Streptomyces sp.]
MRSPLEHQHVPEPLRHTDPAPAADAATTENLLRCWVRETGVPQPEDGVLRLDLPASGTVVEASVLHWSAVGWHRFGPARMSTGTPVAAPALAALIAVETAATDPEAVADLTARVIDSSRHVARFVQVRREAPEAPEGTTPFLAGEQSLI